MSAEEDAFPGNPPREPRPKIQNHPNFFRRNRVEMKTGGDEQRPVETRGQFLKKDIDKIPIAMTGKIHRQRQRASGSAADCPDMVQGAAGDDEANVRPRAKSPNIDRNPALSNRIIF